MREDNELWESKGDLGERESQGDLGERGSQGWDLAGQPPPFRSQSRQFE